MKADVELKVRGEFLYLYYYENNKRIRKSTGLKNTKVNTAYAIRNLIPEIERKLRMGINTQTSYKMSYFADKVIAKAELQTKINTLYTYKAGFKMFFEKLVDKDIGDYSVKDIETFIAGLTPKTARSYLVPVSLAFKLAMKYEIIGRNPVQYVDLPKIQIKEREVFDALTIKSLIDYAVGDLKTFLFIAFYTGGRANEVLALNWSDISDYDITFSKTYAKKRVNTTKSGKPRKVILLDPLRDYLNKLDKNDKFIIKSSYSVILKEFKKLQINLGLVPQSLHITRHTYASLLMNAKAKPILVQQMLGHSSLDITSIYTHYMQSASDKAELEKAFM